MNEIVLVKENIKFEMGKAYVLKRQAKDGSLSNTLLHAIKQDSYKTDDKGYIIFISLEQTIDEIKDKISIYNKENNLNDNTNIILTYIRNGNIEELIASKINKYKNIMGVVVDNISRIKHKCDMNNIDYMKYLSNKYDIVMIGSIQEKSVSDSNDYINQFLEI